MINLLRLGFKDFFTAKFITLSILPLFLSIASLAWLTIWGGGEIFDLLSEGAKSGDYGFIESINGADTFKFLAKFLQSFTLADLYAALKF